MQTLASASTSIDLSSSIRSSEFYEAAILADETEIDNYWYLGISYLLAGREDDAQAAWFVPLSGDDSDRIDLLTNELLIILDREANNQAQAPDFENAWLLRQHLWLIAPDRIENILQLISLANNLNLLTSELLAEWQIDELLKTVLVGNLDEDLLKETISILLHNYLGLELIKSCLQLFGDSRYLLITKIVVAAFNLFGQQKAGIFAISIVELCQSLSPNNLEVYQALVLMYSNSGSHPKSIAAAEYYDQLVSSPIDKLFASYMMQRSSLAAGGWQDGINRVDQHWKSLEAVIQDLPHDLNTDRLE